MVQEEAAHTLSHLVRDHWPAKEALFALEGGVASLIDIDADGDLDAFCSKAVAVPGPYKTPSRSWSTRPSTTASASSRVIARFRSVPMLATMARNRSSSSSLAVKAACKAR